MPSNLASSQSYGYGNTRIVKASFDDAVSRMESALKAEGFGVLCAIDIRSKMKEKLGVDFPRYVILGACNPALALQSLKVDINLGLLLPCNAVVYEQAGQTHVGIIDARKMLSVVDRPELDVLAHQVNEKLQRVLQAVVSELSAPA
jgi:uncharacterized protein (DUF302 family)